MVGIAMGHLEGEIVGVWVGSAQTHVGPLRLISCVGKWKQRKKVVKKKTVYSEKFVYQLSHSRAAP